MRRLCMVSSLCTVRIYIPVTSEGQPRWVVLCLGNCVRVLQLIVLVTYCEHSEEYHGDIYIPLGEAGPQNRESSHYQNIHYIRGKPHKHAAAIMNLAR
jgi:hypothetical protein